MKNFGLNKLIENKSLLIKLFGMSFILVLLVIIILPNFIDLHYNLKGFLRDIYSNIFGLLLDIFLFGLIITIVQIILDKQNDITRELDQIDDFRGWKSEEASHRILGCVKRLQRLAYKSPELSSCHIEGMTLKDIEFIHTKMTFVCFNKSTFYNCSFTNVDSNNFTCCDGRIQGTFFKNGKMNLYLHRSDIGSGLFYNLNANQSIFQRVKLSSCLFEKVDLSHSNLEFESCELTEFKECVFDEARVSQNWFDELCKPDNLNIGIDKIKDQYDIVQSEEPSPNGPRKVWVLRKKGQEGPTKKPVVVIKSENVIVLNNPWTELGRCRQFSHEDIVNEQLNILNSDDISQQQSDSPDKK